MRSGVDFDKARFGIPEAAFSSRGYGGFGGDPRPPPRSNYRKTREQIFAGREERARLLADDCKPRPWSGDGGCGFPRGVPFRDKSGVLRHQLLPCGWCDYCHEQAVRSEAALIMSEVSTSDWAVFTTHTYADPADDAVLQAEGEADSFDLSLSPRERQFRVRQRAERANRRDDRAHVDLNRDHIAEYVRRLNAAGLKQGKVALQAWRRAQIAALVDEALAECPRFRGETVKAYQRRVRSVRRAVKQQFYSEEALASRAEIERDIVAKEGFTVRVWRVGQYGGKTNRPHFHTIACGTGKPPKHWPQPYKGKTKFDFVHDLQWPHGHMQIDWQVTEANARYLARYIMNGVGKPRGATVEAPRPRWSAKWVRDPRTGKVIRPGSFVRPRKGGYKFARLMGLTWAKSGLFPADFRFEAPGCRDQRAVYRVVGSANSPGGDNRRTQLVHGGRASMMSGARRRWALEAMCEAWQIDPRDVLEFADNRGDEFLNQTVEKFVRWSEAKAAKADAYDRADNMDYLAARVAARKGLTAPASVSTGVGAGLGLSEARSRALAVASAEAGRVGLYAEDRRLSEVAARGKAFDDRDAIGEGFDRDDERDRQASGARFRAKLGPRFHSSPDEVAAYAAQVALAASGQLVWQDGAWVDLRAPP